MLKYKVLICCHPAARLTGCHAAQCHQTPPCWFKLPTVFPANYFGLGKIIYGKFGSIASRLVAQAGWSIDCLLKLWVPSRRTAFGVAIGEHIDQGLRFLRAVIWPQLLSVPAAASSLTDAWTSSSNYQTDYNAPHSNPHAGGRPHGDQPCIHT